MVKVTYGNDGFRSGVDKTETERCGGVPKLIKKDIRDLHLQVYQANGERKYIIEEGKEKLDIQNKRLCLEVKIEDLDRTDFHGIKNINYKVVDLEGEPYIQISCKIGRKQFNWVPKLMDVPRDVRDAIEEID